jgi:hypothetical protein
MCPLLVCLHPKTFGVVQFPTKLLVPTRPPVIAADLSLRRELGQGPTSFFDWSFCILQNRLQKCTNESILVKLDVQDEVSSGEPRWAFIPHAQQILKQIYKYRRHCLWRGGDINGRKPPLAAWKMVTKPKLKDGLGVINLRMHNEVLLVKNLQKLYNKEDLLCVQLIWTNYYGNGQVPGQAKKGSFWW